jgi:hypothetical protein
LTAFLAIALVALVFATVSPAGVLARPVPEGARAPLQAPATPSITVSLQSDRLTCRAQYQELVLAELTHPDGTKASGEGLGDGSGEATIFFLPLGTGDVDTTIGPGDKITLARMLQRPSTYDVPELSADVDVTADRIVGTAPAGASVRIAVEYGTPTASLAETVTADASGRFVLDLAGRADLTPRDTGGSATYDAAGGVRAMAVFAAFSGEVTIGAHRASGHGTPGTSIEVALRHADGTVLTPPPAQVDGDGSWTVRAPLGQPTDPATAVRAGDIVTITRSGGPIPRPVSAAFVVPDIRLDVDPSRDRVTGVAPAGWPIAVTAWPISGAEVKGAATTAADGTFAVDLAGRADLGPGWRVRADWSATPEISVGALTVLPQALVGVHTATVRGLAQPGASVTVTLRAADGALRYNEVAVAGDMGDFASTMGGIMPDTQLSIEPGDKIDVTYVAGDPLSATVPELTAKSDDVADTVSGHAGFGARMRVFVRDDPSAPVLDVSADGSGAYRADFAGQYDLRRPVDGSVTMNPAANLAFYTTWSAIQLNVQMQGNIVVLLANGAPGREYTARLIAADGKVVGQSSGRIFDLTASDEATAMIGSGGFFYLIFTDVTGNLVRVAAGDTIEISAGDDRASLVVPPLDATVFVEEDVIAGRTAPDTPVIVMVTSMTGTRHATQAVADAQGTFSHDFSGEYDLHYNDTVQLVTIVGGHTVTKYLDAPGLTLDLDDSTLNGSLPLEGPATIRVTVRRGGQTVFETTAMAYSGGAFYVPVVDSGGAPLELRPGDQIAVQPMDPAGDAVTMDVPELTVEADPASERIWGRATPGGSLVLIAINNLARITGFPLGQAWPDISASGDWTGVTVPTIDVRPGTRVQASYRVPSGHVALRNRYVPLAGVEHGGPNVCGISQPRQPVEAALYAAAGARLAGAQSVAGADAAYQLVLRDDGDRMVSTQTGQRVHATLAGKQTDVDLPVLELAIDWANNRLTGVGPADSDFYLNFPARRCMEASNPLDTSAVMMGFTHSDADGRFTLPLVPTVPGQGFQVSFDTPDDHYIFRQIYRALGQVYIDRDRVSGTTDSAAPVTLQLATGHGTVRANASGASDADGRFDLHFPAGTVIAAGDVVTVTAAGDTAGITVEPLSFDWSPGEPVVGSAPAGRTVSLDLRVVYAPTYWRVLTVALPVGPDGVFRFGPDEVPPRADWTWSQVDALRAVLTTGNGHQIIDQTDNFESAPAAPGHAIYLPIARHGLAPAGVAPASASQTSAPRASASRTGASRTGASRAATGVVRTGVVRGGGVRAGAAGWAPAERRSPGAAITGGVAATAGGIGRTTVPGIEMAAAAARRAALIEGVRRLVSESPGH